MKFFGFSVGPRSIVVVLAGLLLAAFVWLLDYLTRYEISLSIFYLIPIALVTWYKGRDIGIVMSLICAAAWFVADRKSGYYYSHFLIPYWNAAGGLGIFLIVCLTLSKLKSLLEKEKISARRDALTGLSNMKAFSESAVLEMERSRRYGHPLTIVFMDVDDFKVINDNFGHKAGDSLLCAMANTMRNNLRPPDIPARTGGDEFLIILPETGLESAKEVLGRLQEVLLASMKENKWPVTFSIGAATYTEPPDSLDEMIKSADELMYSVKFNGKNNLRLEAL